MADVQRFSTAIGGFLSRLLSVPSLTPATDQLVYGAFSLEADNLTYASSGAALTLNQLDRGGYTLGVGEEYSGLIYARTTGPGACDVTVLKGAKGPTGGSVLPTDSSPSTHYPLGTFVVPYSATGHATPTVSATGSTTPINISSLRPFNRDEATSGSGMVGIIHRDSIAPNAGARHVELSLPSADSGVESGDVRVSFGYPLAFEFLDEPTVVYESPYAWSGPPPRTGRVDFDMAFVYAPPRLGIEYAPGHVCLGGPDIPEPDDSEILSTISPTPETALDVHANVLVLPNGEIGLSRLYDDAGTPVVPQRIERFRVRPAPDAAPSYSVSRESWTGWGNDTNPWVAFVTYSLVPWGVHDTTVTLSAGSWKHGRQLPCVVWQYNSVQNHHSLDAHAVYGLLGEPSGMTCATSFADGELPALQPGKSCRLTILGTLPVLSYGWTFTAPDANGFEVESALSPLSPLGSVPLTGATIPTFTLSPAVPVGPTGTVRRTVYRFGYDNEVYRLTSPWDPRSTHEGPVYDRMFVKIGTVEGNSPVDFVDIETTLTFAGQRPPSPFIGPIGAGITLDTRPRVIALPPLHL